jgi:Holliday junction resolvasome RuvABC endonuclease subunit
MLRIMGIDPSHVNVGWAVIEADVAGLVHHVAHGTLILPDGYKKDTSPIAVKYEQYNIQAKDILTLAKKYKANHVIFEDMFAKSFMMRSVEARAVMMALLAEKFYDIDVFNAMTAKRMYCGSAKAKKADMKKAMTTLYNLIGTISVHAADALAVASGYYVQCYVQSLKVGKHEAKHRK